MRVCGRGACVAAAAGTGKTLALLCAALSWQQAQLKNKINRKVAECCPDGASKAVAVAAGIPSADPTQPAAAAPPSLRAASTAPANGTALAMVKRDAGAGPGRLDGSDPEGDDDVDDAVSQRSAAFGAAAVLAFGLTAAAAVVGLLFPSSAAAVER